MVLKYLEDRRWLHFGHGLLHLDGIFLELPNNPIFREHDMGPFYSQIYINRDHGRIKNITCLVFQAGKDFVQGIRSLKNGFHCWRLRNGVATTGLLSARARLSKTSFKPCSPRVPEASFTYLSALNWLQF